MEAYHPGACTVRRLHLDQPAPAEACTVRRLHLDQPAPAEAWEAFNVA